MIKECLTKLVEKQDLTYNEANGCIDEIMSGDVSYGVTGAFLTALATKKETVEEISGCASAMREHATKMGNDLELLEIVGTGGDHAKSFNISTTSSLVIASAGVKVAKHGNRAASSASGAADCLESLGVNINIEPERCLELLNKINICFFFAQKYHTSMKYVGPVRKELGIRTVFNLLGPLTNPASPSMQILGVYSEELIVPMAKVLMNLGVKHGMVVYGTDRLDEISVSSPTKICEFRDGELHSYTITPEDFGFKTCEKSELTGGTPQENAQITLDILTGKEKGAKRTAVLMNAGAALYIANKTETFEEGIQLAAELINSQKAYNKLQEFIEESNR